MVGVLGGGGGVTGREVTVGSRGGGGACGESLMGGW